MGGASIGGQFLAAGLLNEIKIHLVPVILGTGTPLFGGVVRDKVLLEQLEVERGEKGDAPPLPGLASSILGLMDVIRALGQRGQP